MMDRRKFFIKTALTGAGVAFIPEILKASIPESYKENALAGKAPFSKDATIVFQGDSITDAGRNRDEESIPNKQSMFGSGYAMFAAAELMCKFPENNLQIYNRGISGNKVYQLRERWEKDCLLLKPEVLSILIGVNDYWHRKTGNYEGDLAKYDADFRNLISDTKKQLPGIKIVICEPFIIAGGTALDATWEGEFSPYRKAAKQIAFDFETKFVPFQTIFNEALKKAPASYWGNDGVHPSMAGAQLMAQAWINVVA